jgi:hypothetical protein
MPQRPKTFTIGRVQIHPHERTAQIRTGPRTAAPSRFSAIIQTKAPDLEIAVAIVLEEGGTPVVEELVVHPSPGTRLSSTTLRGLLLDPVVRSAVQAASRPVIERPDVHRNAFQIKGEPGENQAWVSVPAGADERVQQVARLYREALAAGSRAPAEEAAKAVNISRAQVARYIRRARAAGLLPPVADVVKGLVPPVAPPVPEPEQDQRRSPMLRMTDPSSW